MVWKDQIGRSVKLREGPQRIISLVPSQTELLHKLGLAEEVIGITKFCLYPEDWRQDKVIVGGTKQIHYDRIVDLNPTLIIGNKEENTQDMIVRLEQDYPVWVSDVQTLEDAFEMIASLGAMLKKATAAKNLIQAIQEQFEMLRPMPKPPIKVAYLIWREPYMVVGAATFIHEMLIKGGMQNVFSDLLRYPVVTMADIQASKPDLIMLSSEPYPFQEKHFLEFEKNLPDSLVQIVDGEMFSWYGSRLLSTPAYLKQLFDQRQQAS